MRSAAVPFREDPELCNSERVGGYARWGHEAALLMKFISSPVVVRPSSRSSGIFTPNVSSRKTLKLTDDIESHSGIWLSGVSGVTSKPTAPGNSSGMQVVANDQDAL